MAGYLWQHRLRNLGKERIDEEANRILTKKGCTARYQFLAQNVFFYMSHMLQRDSPVFVLLVLFYSRSKFEGDIRG
jgi:hypothetical protein